MAVFLLDVDHNYVLAFLPICHLSQANLWIYPPNSAVAKIEKYRRSSALKKIEVVERPSRKKYRVGEALLQCTPTYIDH